MADLTNSTVEICEYWKKKLEIAKEDLGIVDVFYGDQERIPKSPTICIEPDVKRAPIRNAGRQTMPEWTIYFMCYHSEIQAQSSNRRDSDTLAERLEDLLNSDPQMGGLVIHCWVSEVQSGYARKTNALMRSSRITFSANSRHQLPMSS